MALFLFCQIISYVVETNLDSETLLKFQDRNSRFQNLCILLKFFKKLSSLQSWIFSNFGHFSNLFWLFFTY